MCDKMREETLVFTCVIFFMASVSAFYEGLLENGSGLLFMCFLLPWISNFQDENQAD